MTIRRPFKAASKAGLALEALRGDRTIQEKRARRVVAQDVERLRRISWIDQRIRSSGL